MWDALIGQAVNLLSGEQKKKDQQIKDQARMYMGEAPSEDAAGGGEGGGGLGGALGGLLGGGEGGLPGLGGVDLGSKGFNDPTPEGAPSLQQVASGRGKSSRANAIGTDLTKGTGSWIDSTFGTRADDRELL